ncbi:hypothetical protein Q7P35_011256 [Cladosporium inversicolor]
MALVPYNDYIPTHISRPSTHSSRNTHHSSSTHRSPASAPSRHSSSRSNSSSSASSAGSSYTRISTQTFGISSRPGYAPGQAPHDYFYNENMREEWDNAPVGSDGRRVRQTRIRSRGSEWSERDTHLSPMSSIGSGQSQRGSSYRRFVEDGEDASDNETVSPADSISQVSSQPSRYSSRRSGVTMGSARDHYPQPGYSQRPSVIDVRQGGMHTGPGGSRIGSDMISVANGRLVRVEVPDLL